MRCGCIQKDWNIKIFTGLLGVFSASIRRYKSYEKLAIILIGIVASSYRGVNPIMMNCRSKASG